MRTRYATNQPKPMGYRMHRVPRWQHRDYESALDAARARYGDARRAGGSHARYWLMYVPEQEEQR
jgi:hypothetical protein